MGSGGRRRGAGRPGWRAKCEDYFRLDVRKLHSLAPDTRGSYRWTCGGEPSGAVGYVVHPTCITLIYAWSPPSAPQVSKRLDVPLESTPCHFGGSRPWFRCPSCDRRCAIVYGVTRDGGFACRLCMDLAYASEAEDPQDRLRRKIWKLEDRLDSQGMHWLAPHRGRPVGMHWRTYDRIYDRIMEADAKLTAGTLRLLARLDYS